MLKKVELDKLEAHWAVSSIPEDVRRTCFDKLRKNKYVMLLEIVLNLQMT